ncbi:hypothetical protein EDD37DRAFT_651756 [Exophiala viscosa]|uniref:Uncharacterized protein n=1 Tax=Exophiala viscosa TaxID=2486360 RepID=A0AAN6IFW7_9EURO|nr:hypothetical protein EDD36DRAFT_463822 [Exophiala viscosa]KAI1622482.1 hypothetical protein EDD37DRAFT_651756 [Exophiala viscosa]
MSGTSFSTLARRANSVSCSATVDPKLPSNFLCPSGDNCISLDSSSSGLCCPDTSNCATIQTITCDIQTQNLTSNPNAAIFTTRLGDKLPTCGSSCCPFGYECVTSSQSPICQLIANTSIEGKNNTSTSSTSSSTSSATSSTASKTATSTSSTTATSTPLSTGVSSSSSAAESTCNRFPVGVFLAGFFPGMFIGAFMMLAWVICSGRHRKPTSRNSTGSSVYKPTISDPIPLDSGGLRTDFLRKTTDRAKSMFSTNSQITSPAESHWKMPTPPVPNNIPAAHLPVTPERRLAHELSSESIRVYSPPSGTGVVMPVPSHIAPLRGMAAQRFQATNMGSPFQSPPPTSNPADTSNSILPTKKERGVSTYSGVSSLSENDEQQAQTLTPARYEPTGWTPPKRVRPEGTEEQSRPTTTFTEMLHEAGFPDPIREDHGTPAVPKIPNGYGRNRT